MRSWSRVIAGSATHVVDRPSLWLPGGLAWVLTIGWLALFLGVARAPTLAELTFFGAGMFTSGAWPWNLVAFVAAALAVVVGAAALIAVAEAVLVRSATASPSDAGRILLVTLVCGAPAALALVALGFGIAAVAPAEFNAPQDGGGTVARIALAVAPLIVAFLLAAAAGSAVHAAAARRVMQGSSAPEALRGAPAALRRAGGAALAQATFLALVRVIFLVIAALLLRVLWDPIAARLDRAGFDLAVALLLVGFVAIWLCLVLGGGALHAIGSVSWTGVLGTPPPEPMPGPTGQETPAPS